MIYKCLSGICHIHQWVSHLSLLGILTILAHEWENTGVSQLSLSFLGFIVYLIACSHCLVNEIMSSIIHRVCLQYLGLKYAYSDCPLCLQEDRSTGQTKIYNWWLSMSQVYS